MSRIANQFGRAIRKVGGFIVVRYVTRPAPSMVNPPTMISPAVDATVTWPAGTISIRAADVQGILVAGDVLVILGQRYTVAANAACRPASAATPGFDGVALTPAPPLIADGTPVTPIWAADKLCRARIRPVSQSLVDGDRVQAEDMRVRIAAVSLPSKPNANTDMLLVDGRTLSVVSAVPVYIRNEIIYYDIQARN